MSNPTWSESFRDPRLSDAVTLNAFGGMACERGGTAPDRDDGYFSLVVERRPVMQYAPPATQEADAVPNIFDTQVRNSCGFDIGNDQIYVTQDTALFCTDRPSV